MRELDDEGMKELLRRSDEWAARGNYARSESAASTRSRRPRQHPSRAGADGIPSLRLAGSLGGTPREHDSTMNASVDNLRRVFDPSPGKTRGSIDDIQFEQPLPLDHIERPSPVHSAFPEQGSVIVGKSLEAPSLVQEAKLTPELQPEQSQIQQHTVVNSARILFPEIDDD